MVEQAEQRGARKTREGVVVSRSGNKTIVVSVERRRPHPLYGKVVRSCRRFHVHDEDNKAVEGDRVRIVESRPMSRMKRWRLVVVLLRDGSDAGRGAVES